MTDRPTSDRPAHEATCGVCGKPLTFANIGTHDACLRHLYSRGLDGPRDEKGTADA